MARKNRQQARESHYEQLKKNYSWHERRFQEVSHWKPGSLKYQSRLQALGEAHRRLQHYTQMLPVQKLITYAA
jgi:hypothetical protein